VFRIVALPNRIDHVTDAAAAILFRALRVSLIGESADEPSDRLNAGNADPYANYVPANAQQVIVNWFNKAADQALNSVHN